MDIKEQLNKEEIDQIYEGELDLNTTLQNPILRPIAEANKSYTSLALLILKSLYDYEESYQVIKEMIDENPRYAETMIITKVMNLISHVKQIVRSQDIQIDNLKNTIQEMININNSEYTLISKGEEEVIDLPQKSSTEVFDDIKKIAEEEEKEEEEEEPFVSSLTDKEVPIQKE